MSSNRSFVPTGPTWAVGVIVTVIIVFKKTVK